MATLGRTVLGGRTLCTLATPLGPELRGWPPTTLATPLGAVPVSLVVLVVDVLDGKVVVLAGACAWDGASPLRGAAVLVVVPLDAAAPVPGTEDRGTVVGETVVVEAAVVGGAVLGVLELAPGALDEPWRAISWWPCRGVEAPGARAAAPTLVRLVTMTRTATTAVPHRTPTTGEEGTTCGRLAFMGPTRASHPGEAPAQWFSCS